MKNRSTERHLVDTGTSSCHKWKNQNVPMAEGYPAERAEGSLKNREWLTTEQAADYLGLSVGALRNMTSNGQVPYHKLGRRNRYSVVELRQLLLSKKRGGCHGS